MDSDQSSGCGRTLSCRGGTGTSGRHGHGRGSSSCNSSLPVNSVRPSFSQLLADNLWSAHPPSLSLIHQILPPPPIHLPPSYAPETQTLNILDTQTPPVPVTHEAGSSSLTIGVYDHNDNRMWIRPINQSFKPIKVGRMITNIIKSKFENPITEWKETTPEQRDYYFGEFKKKYKWDPSYDKEVEKVWEMKNKVALRQTMHKVRCGKDKARWIPENVKAEVERKWAEQACMMRKEQEMHNRASQTYRFVHTGGSIPAMEHKEWLWEKYDREPTHVELFLVAHQKKGMEEFIDARSTSLYENFTQMKETTFHMHLLLHQVSESCLMVMP